MNLDDVADVRKIVDVLGLMHEAIRLSSPAASEDRDTCLRDAADLLADLRETYRGPHFLVADPDDD